LSASENNLIRHAFPEGAPFDKIVAAFTVRNLNTGLHTCDDPINILENRKRIFGELGLDPDSFTAAQQVHGDTVARVTQRERGRGARRYDDAIPATDALITDVPGVPIGVFTADCVPIFLYDPERSAVGIVHAGWRSSVLGIVAKAVAEMKKELGADPARTWAAFGPCIGPCCYEVGADVYERFSTRFDYGHSLFRETGNGKWHLDLWLANRRQLIDSGIRDERIINPEICSVCNSHQYFSARRHGPRAGRTLSVIAIKET
jgi:hypothetical protein